MDRVVSSSLAKLIAFYGCSCLMTWLCWLSILAEKRGLLNLGGRAEWLATAGQFGPFAAALAWTWIEHGPGGVLALLRRLVQPTIGPACLVVALLLPPLLFGVAIYVNVLLGWQSAPRVSIPEPVGTTLHYLLNLFVGGALGEEPGWRGYALPRLRALFSPLTASVVLALAWACWHLPLWWIAEVPSSFPFYVFGMIPLTILFTWLDDWAKGSVLVSLLFHASLNASLVRLPVFPAILFVNVFFWVVAIPVVCIAPQRWLAPAAPGRRFDCKSNQDGSRSKSTAGTRPANGGAKP